MPRYFLAPLRWLSERLQWLAVAHPSYDDLMCGQALYDRDVVAPPCPVQSV